MSVGSLFLVLAFVLWFLQGLGVHTIPGAESFAHACLALGLLLGGYVFPWRWGPRA
jgi:hypothetical protein